jgi:hypothetical protein
MASNSYNLQAVSDYVEAFADARCYMLIRDEPNTIIPKIRSVEPESQI